ncbi:hypothetical protein GCM10027610_043430 [Dactylosporangium cerinum]
MPNCRSDCSWTGRDPFPPQGVRGQDDHDDVDGDLGTGAAVGTYFQPGQAWTAGSQDVQAPVGLSQILAS